MVGIGFNQTVILIAKTIRFGKKAILETRSNYQSIKTDQTQSLQSLEI